MKTTKSGKFNFETQASSPHQNEWSARPVAERHTANATSTRVHLWRCPIVALGVCIVLAYGRALANSFASLCSRRSSSSKSVVPSPRMAPHGDEAPASTHDSKSTKPDEEIEAVKHKKAKSPEYANMLALAKKVRSVFQFSASHRVKPQVRVPSARAGPLCMHAFRADWHGLPAHNLVTRRVWLHSLRRSSVSYAESRWAVYPYHRSQADHLARFQSLPVCIPLIIFFLRSVCFFRRPIPRRV